jgi:ABC-2 type transport system permease protein
MSDPAASAQPVRVPVWDGLRKAWAISSKDMKIYYFQPAVLIFGLVFPIAIFFAFMIGRR